MNTSAHLSRSCLVSLLLIAPIIGCHDERPRSKASASSATKQGASKQSATSERDEPPAGNVKRVQLSPGVWIENDGKKRRVVVNTAVCLREGDYGLECLLCRKQTKEHESILSTEADASKIHAALIVAGAKQGSPVEFDPTFKPPTGSRIKVTLAYKNKETGKIVREPAQRWILNGKTNKDLEYDWVFAGSQLWKNTLDETKPPKYAANDDGAFICVSNVSTAMLDLPVNSPRGLEERPYVMRTERIPEKGTPVDVILEVVPDEKK